MEVTSATEGNIQTEILPNREEEKQEEVVESPQPTTSGEHMEQMRHEEAQGMAEVQREEKNENIRIQLKGLLSIIQSGKSVDYPLWANTFHQITEETDRQSYRANKELFTLIINHLVHPPNSIPAAIYIPLLWDIGLDLLWLDFSKCRQIEKEYFYATFRIPNLVLQASKEFELGNHDKALSLLDQAKSFLEMHYSNIPILADRRGNEKAGYTLNIAELEKKIDPERALTTLTDYMKTQARSMDMKQFFEKWVVFIVIFYVSRQAIFG